MAGGMSQKLPKIRDEEREAKVSRSSVNTWPVVALTSPRLRVTVWVRVRRVWAGRDCRAHVRVGHVRAGQGGLQRTGRRDHQAGGGHGHHTGQQKKQNLKKSLFACLSGQTFKIQC